MPQSKGNYLDFQTCHCLDKSFNTVTKTAFGKRLANEGKDMTETLVFYAN